MESLLGLTPVVNISTLFRELPLLERPAAAAAAGYRHIEAWWPWEHVPAPSDAEADAFIQAITDAGVQLVGLNTFAGELSGPDAGILSDPARGTEFSDGLDAALDLAGRLGVRVLNTLYGNRIEGISPEHQDDVATERLVAASARAAAANTTLLIEPLSGDKPYPLRTSRDALAVVDRVLTVRGLDAGTRNTGIGWLMDLYHLAANGQTSSEVEADIAEFGSRATHLQVADNPGRRAPGTGTVPLGRQVNQLVAAGYQGYLALEFVSAPGESSVDALASMAFAP